MTALLIMIFVGANIAAQLYLIRKDKEQVTKKDYITFFFQSIYITGCVLLMRCVYMMATKWMQL